MGEVLSAISACFKRCFSKSSDNPGVTSITYERKQSIVIQASPEAEGYKITTSLSARYIQSGGGEVQKNAYEAANSVSMGQAPFDSFFNNFLSKSSSNQGVELVGKNPDNLKIVAPIPDID